MNRKEVLSRYNKTRINIIGSHHDCWLELNDVLWTAGVLRPQASVAWNTPFLNFLFSYLCSNKLLYYSIYPGNSKKPYLTCIYQKKKNVILVLHILVCTKWIVYLDLWWNIGYLQGPPRDRAYGYVSLNIPPRAPSRTPRLNNMQIYIEIYCYSTTDTKGQCFWRCPTYIAVTFHLESEAEKQDINGGKSICSVFSRAHPTVLVYCDFHNYKFNLLSLYHLSY